ncbi:flagellar basal body rod protein FlgB [Duganella sp. HH105]|uniref:flagellar basal body rod protein FlgB n=1 Tax=Duganella sp. HH105 TaxID=1781067 RepID=UPI000877DA0F|nr:flagellar basal body rod protein FlgB [Duganella sp. HH105]OEZ53801.1 flagellar basal body rod protein FlgB [Duganella sp. HH105]
MDSAKGRAVAIAGFTKDEFWENALRISEQRLSVLASNIANADTPNYKARDIDFRASLQQAIAASSAAHPKAEVTSSLSKDRPFVATLMYRIPTQGAIDGNTVEMDTERAAFSDQAIRHEFLLQKASDEYKEIGALFKNMVG